VQISYDFQLVRHIKSPIVDDLSFMDWVNDQILNLIIPLQTITLYLEQKLIQGRPWPPLSTNLVHIKPRT